MAMEIERKFLVRSDDWRPLVTAKRRLCQGYLSRRGGLSTRIRIIEGASAVLTIKSKTALTRAEFEYPIPIDDAEQLLALRQSGLIAKTRHIVPWRALTWEIDVFEGDNTGLVIAEIELESESQQLELPPWIGAEITGQPRYYNSGLADHPFRLWSAEERDAGGDTTRPGPKV
jgi:adenylate cyclase